jgi:hypothetical protein
MAGWQRGRPQRFGVVMISPPHNIVANHTEISSYVRHTGLLRSPRPHIASEVQLAGKHFFSWE